MRQHIACGLSILLGSTGLPAVAGTSATKSATVKAATENAASTRDESARQRVNSSTASHDQWIDRKRQDVGGFVAERVQQIDNLFKNDDNSDAAKRNPPARASLRLYLDNDWNRYAGINTKIRLRGRMHLPQMNERFNVVFGDDTLDDERDSDITQRADAATSNQKITDSSELPAFEQVKADALSENASLALRYAYKTYKDSNMDIDLGVRSGTDIYVRARFQQQRALSDTWALVFEPMVRYGIKSELYAQQLTSFRYTPDVSGDGMTALLFDHFHANTLLSYTHKNNSADNPEGVRWSQRLQLHRDMHSAQHTFDYGLQFDGRIRDLHSNLDSYGVFTSYRQPFLRDWFFVRGDVNYLVDRRLDRDWHPSVFLRLEAGF